MECEKIYVEMAQFRVGDLPPVENCHEGSISPTSSTTLDVWIRRCSFWNGLRKLGVEAMVVWTSG